MKNGYTPLEYAHAIAIDALSSAISNSMGELEGLTIKESERVTLYMIELRKHLADKAKMDIE